MSGRHSLLHIRPLITLHRIAFWAVPQDAPYVLEAFCDAFQAEEPPAKLVRAAALPPPCALARADGRVHL